MRSLVSPNHNFAHKCLMLSCNGNYCQRHSLPVYISKLVMPIASITIVENKFPLMAIGGSIHHFWAAIGRSGLMIIFCCLGWYYRGVQLSRQHSLTQVIYGKHVQLSLIDDPPEYYLQIILRKSHFLIPHALY